MSATRFIWGGLVLIFVAIILYQWQQMEPEVEDAALLMSSREILSSANEFKNYWVVNGQPKSIVKDNVDITFTPLGWPITLKDNELDCQKWLYILLPEKQKIYTDFIHVSKKKADMLRFGCKYSMSNGKVISVMLVNGVFKVNVGFLNNN
ncbi:MULTISPECIES: type IV pilus, mannose-sensitive hemagglutinin protein MshF [unclassified Aliivibrio]|jgi:MSHA biogenesis protein MshF|uniref:type IV pilus, mannose-sensitive hemagglutinin protein MshF n=1 Tax=unclassified Aliivibrio TaxID=2645654 RepID=UPI00080EB89F|nr:MULTISPECIES: type IV pilus, mannose-sensitive hemagglutinin protein MshF [unclassified Aliivibrio]OCH13213.1 type IV pilus, mannose-sensitive hemagglutinin protein MshF [Aliivibrio sp. 1S165]OCH25214.1 type IV pilus, mannose-sensitive hemagglutinin protein MshF [Aliivibrio sp. 1S128]OCH28097.1 type IV pilus, mannose-sensitive hemagglutinin protein MshF [Aliivibrio sp. 1S175]